MIECGGLYGRGLTFDPVQVSCEDEKKSLVQNFGCGGFSIMADFSFCHALAGENFFFGFKPIHIIYHSIKNFLLITKKVRTMV